MNRAAFLVALGIWIYALTKVCPGQENLPAGNEEVARIMRDFVGRGDLGDGGQPLPPDMTVDALTVASDLKIELVASEPQITQPIHLTFDHQGRLWVVQYRQYPFPAGLKVVRYDQHLRAIFDRVPQPPPHHVAGRDVISILEDLNGDGVFETQREVINGLNIATSVAIGSGGIWVMNPPYLLFYPDANDDGVPDSDPEVHLSGFGLEDTHSVANSLILAPDGWLYGANGSTTTANVIATKGTSGVETRFSGQCIWRYHPQQHEFEIYAEGGGNPFGMEFDATGHVFSGTNNGDARGMYYPQGSYGIKSWGKHGPLTNRFAFGYFEHMGFQGDGRRFTEEFVLYEDSILPERYRGQMIAVNPLQRIALASHLVPDTSTYKTVDFENFIETKDRWFRPVDITVGPDGFLYIADWYDTRLTHVDPRDNWHKTSGRIYRVGPRADSSSDASSSTSSLAADRLRTPFNLKLLSDDELVAHLSHPSRWFRMAAVEILSQRLGETRSPEIQSELTSKLWKLLSIDTSQDIVRNPLVRASVDSEQDLKHGAIEALWVLSRSEDFSQPGDTGHRWRIFAHPQPTIRRWAWRIMGDRRLDQPELAAVMMKAIETEQDPQVRSQAASTAARIPGSKGLAIALRMLEQDLDQDYQDRHIPLLLWWALEKHIDGNAVALQSAFAANPSLWNSRIVQQTALSRLMRRSVIRGEEVDLQLCGGLLQEAPNQDIRFILLQGIEEGLAESAKTTVPQTLAEILHRYRQDYPQSDLRLRLRQGDETAIQEAAQTVLSPTLLASDRIALIQILGDLHPKAAQSVLLSGLYDSSPAIRRACLQSLSRFDDPSIGQSIANAYQQSMDASNDLRPIAIRILASRLPWAKQLIAEIDALKIRAEVVPPDVLVQMRSHHDAELDASIDRLWGQVRSSSIDREPLIAKLRHVLETVPGNSEAGGRIFATHCGKCHRLFGQGGEVGPDLTGYERTNFDFLSVAILDPSAAIREEFTNYRLLTVDGLVLTGLLVNQTAETVEIRSAEGQTTIVSRADIDTLQASSESLMPAAILEPLTDQQIADLFTYLTRSAKAN